MLSRCHLTPLLPKDVLDSSMSGLPGSEVARAEIMHSLLLKMISTVVRDQAYGIARSRSRLGLVATVLLPFFCVCFGIFQFCDTHHRRGIFCSAAA